MARHTQWWATLGIAVAGTLAVAATASAANAEGQVSAARELPRLGTITFMAPEQARIRPRRVVTGNSACSPFFDQLRWSSWGQTRAVARGRATLPVYSPRYSCMDALQRAPQRRVVFVASRPRDCSIGRIFTRIPWSYGSRRGGLTSDCI